MGVIDDFCVLGWKSDEFCIKEARLGFEAWFGRQTEHFTEENEEGFTAAIEYVYLKRRGFMMNLEEELAKQAYENEEEEEEQEAEENE